MNPETNLSQSSNHFTLNVLSIIREHQLSNGLRHGDYERYKSYCSKVLLKLHRNDKIGFSHSTGYKAKHFVPREMMVENVLVAKALEIPLFQAERAWAHYMALKEHVALLSSQKDSNPTDPDGKLKFLRVAKQRNYMHRRLAKAAKWSIKLKELCLATGDDRTALEAEAYAGWMNGTLKLERDMFKEALIHFEIVKKMYEQLSQLSSKSLRELYAERLEEVEFALKYCRYYSSDSDKNTDASTLESTHSDLIQSKIDHLLELNRRERAGTESSIVWAGATIPVRSETHRMLLLEAGEREASLVKDNSSEELYLELLSSYDKLLSSIREEKLKLSKKSQQQQQQQQQQSQQQGQHHNASDLLSDLEDISNYVKAQKLICSIQRNIRLAMEEGDKLVANTTTSASSNDKTQVAAIDIVRMFDRIMQSVNELKALSGVEKTPAIQTSITKTIPSLRAKRCRFVAEMYLTMFEFSKAHAMVGLGLGLVDQAIKANTGDKNEVSILESLNQTFRLVECRIRTMALVQKIEKESSSSAEKSFKNDNNGKPRYLLDRLSEFNIENQANIIAFPPPMQAIPCNPIFYDLAYNELSLPESILAYGSSTTKTTTTTTNQGEAKSSSWLGSWLSRG